ncbi:MAG: hypothetical protein LBH91_06550, partial [Prevotellaceae bacterium]|nr:hypothetical protein [Prevotellaceae bacterium]
MKILNFITKLVVGLTVAVAMVACGSALKSYQKGDYYAACEQAISKLRSKPNDTDARFALENAYPMAQNTILRDINNLSAMKTINNYEKIVQFYTHLNKLTESIYHCPAALTIIPNPTNYYNDLQNAKIILVDMYYNEGINLLNTGTINNARTALNHFTKANNYIPGYKEVAFFLEESRYLATLRVIVLNPQTPLRYQLNADFFYTRLMSDIGRNTRWHLVRFYTPLEAEAAQMHDPHQLLVLNFENFTIGNTNKTNNTIEIKRDNVVVGTVEDKDGKKNVYSTVTAKLTISRIEIISAGVLSIRVVDPATGRIINQKNLRRQSV